MLRNFLLGLLGFIFVSAHAAEIIRDPTKPIDVTATAAETQGNMRLDAILIGKTRNIAIISGQRFSIGDKIGGATIIDILPSEVQLQDDSGEYVIKLNPTTIKTPSNKEPSK